MYNFKEKPYQSHLKKFIPILVLLLFVNIVSAQYYIRGEVKDEDNNPVQGVRIYFPSTRYAYYSGNMGGFGIPSSQKYDSIIFSKEGFQEIALHVNTQQYLDVKLKLTSKQANLLRPRLISLTKGVDGPRDPLIIYKGESYTNVVENNYIKTGDDLNTTFSMRIDKASYSNIRRFINNETKVPREAVRIEEMLNYMNLNYKEPPPNEVFALASQSSDCPWNEDHKLVYLNVSSRKLKWDSVPPSNLIFLIDVSGSMDMPNRLPLLKEAFQLLVKNLRDIDQVSIVVYGGNVGIKLQPTKGSEKDKIIAAIEQLHASGDTPGEAALKTAYSLARRTFIKNGNNRIILATDGDFNVGQTSEKELEQLIANERDGSIYLTCLGVGMGNYKDSKIEILAKKGNGNFAYIDNIHEAEKVLVTEFSQTAYTIAGDVSLTVNFDSDLIDEYRLIGFDNKKSSLDDKTSILEGGEIGSGSGMLVIFEVKPAKKNFTKLQGNPLASISLQYKLPGDSTQMVLTKECSNNYVPFSALNADLRFGTAVTMYGLKLKESPYFPGVSWQAVQNIAATAVDSSNYLQLEFLTLLEKSKELYEDNGKKKKQKKGK